MKKKLWIHFTGLISLLAWGVTATLFWADRISPDMASRANISILVFTSFAGGFLLTLLWAALSVVEALDRPVAGRGVARPTLQPPVTSSISKVALKH